MECLTIVVKRDKWNVLIKPTQHVTLTVNIVTTNLIEGNLKGRL